MIKALRYITIIIVSVTILFLGFKWYSNKEEQKRYIEVTRTTIVTQLESLRNLETASMTMQKTVQGRQGLKDILPNATRDNLIQNFLFEDSLEMVVVAKFVAWFNLWNISSWSVIIHEDKSVTIKIPKSEILRTNLTPDTKPLFRKRGVLNAGDIQMESEVRNQALEQMKKEAISKWLLEDAEKNATDAIKWILSPFGINIREVIVE